MPKNGPKKDSTRALASLALLRDARPAKGRAGKKPTSIRIGERNERVDLSSQTVSVGDLRWANIEYGDILPISDKMRTALADAEKSERNQCVILHAASAYI